MEHFALNSSDICGEQVRIVEINGIEIGIIRSQGRVYAYQNLCPHQGGPVCEGVRMPRVTADIGDDGTFLRNNFEVDTIHLVCPWHGWEFDLKSGRAAGDPSVKLRSYPVNERDGRIYVEL